MKGMIITKRAFDHIKKAKVGEEFFLEVDFGLRRVTVQRRETEALIAGTIVISVSETIKDKFCYLLDEKGVRKVTFFSEITNRFYKLTPTSDWPTISISSVPMHRVASPCRDTAAKIELLKPYGVVLDTCMGPGYTAIVAAARAKKIITFEKDETIYAIARLNPLSQRLFEADNIEIRQQDVVKGIEDFKDGCFDCIIHDPPTFKLAPELFSDSFYAALLRVLKKEGKLFHYTPLYKVKHGFDFPATIGKKLKAAGFRELRFSDKASGFLCRK